MGIVVLWGTSEVSEPHVQQTISEISLYTVEPLFYDHSQNQIGVVVKQGWSSTRGLIIL